MNHTEAMDESGDVIGCVGQRRNRCCIFWRCGIESKGYLCGGCMKEREDGEEILVEDGEIVRGWFWVNIMRQDRQSSIAIVQDQV